MDLDSNRLLLELDQALRDINRNIINSQFKKLNLEGLKPVLDLVARARADYLKEAFKLANEFPDELPSIERIEQLKQHRSRFEELVAVSKALETAIERKYLDIQPNT